MFLFPNSLLLICAPELLRNYFLQFPHFEYAWAAFWLLSKFVPHRTCMTIWYWEWVTCIVPQ